MELKTKHTSFRTARLDELCAEIVDCPHSTPVWTNQGYVVLRNQNIRNGRLNLADASYTDKAHYYGRIKRAQPKQGDLVITREAPMGEVCMIPPGLESCLGQRMVLLRPNCSVVNAHYLLYALQTSEVQTAIQIQGGTGSTVSNLRIPVLEALQVPLPPTKLEQQAIAEALSDADALIEGLETLIAKKGHLKQGMMQGLLQPKADWVTVELERVADVIDPHPSHRAPPEVASGIPFVGIGDLNENGDVINSKVRLVAESVFDEHRNRYDVNDQLLGLGRVASIGKVVKLKPSAQKYVVSPTLGVIRGRSASRDYLFHLLKSKFVQSQFSRIMSGSTRSSVGMIVLRKLHISMPQSEAERNTVATILSDMDAEIAALESKLTKARRVKAGLMQDLLTGRVRLV